MLGEITGGEDAGGWGLPARPVVTDAGYGEITAFRLGLHARGLPYVAAVSGATRAYPASAVPERVPYARRGRPPAPRYRDKPLRRPDPLRRPPRTPGPTRRLDRHLPHLPATPARLSQAPTWPHLTKPY